MTLLAKWLGVVMLVLLLMFIIVQVSTPKTEDEAFQIIGFDSPINDVMIVRDSVDCTVKYEMTDGILWVYLLPR